MMGEIRRIGFLADTHSRKADGSDLPQQALDAFGRAAAIVRRLANFICSTHGLPGSVDVEYLSSSLAYPCCWGMAMVIVVADSFLNLVSVLLNNTRVPHSFAQFDSGAGFVSSLLLTNPWRTRTASGVVSFFDEQGRPLAVSVNDGPAANRVAFKVRPLGSVTFTTSGTGDLATGSLLVRANVPVAGVVRFFHPSLGSASVAESPRLRAWMTPVRRDARRDINTGVAFSNPQAHVLEVRLSLRGLDGNEVLNGSATERLPPRGRLARLLNELFPGAETAAFEGTLMAMATTPGGRMTATAVEIRSAQERLIPWPVIAVDPVPEATRLFFPQFTSGSGLKASLFLTNPSSSYVSGEASFFDDAGNPLAIAVNGQLPAQSMPFGVPPHGSIVLSTDGRGNLLSGWARVTADRAGGGILRLEDPSLGIAAVAASEPMISFIMPVTRSIHRGMNTGVAMASLDAPVTLRLTLRDRRGEPVDQGQITMSLGANARVSRFIDELFPQAITGEFDGTLTVEAEEPRIVATVLRVGVHNGELTTLPVTALR